MRLLRNGEVNGMRQCYRGIKSMEHVFAVMQTGYPNVRSGKSFLTESSMVLHNTFSHFMI